MTGAMDGHAEDRGRVYQASGDQHISEHHHYGDEAATPGGPDSVRRPAVGGPRSFCVIASKCWNVYEQACVRGVVVRPTCCTAWVAAARPRSPTRSSS